MDRKRVWKERPAERVTGFSFEQEYLDTQYTVQPVYQAIGDTGRLDVLKIVPRDTTLPTFVGRWDESAKSLDFEIEDAPAHMRKKFPGHHTTRGDRNTRSFRLDVVYNARPIVRGTVTFAFYLGARGVIADHTIAVKVIPKSAE
jgi:hypothetical protein